MEWEWKRERESTFLSKKLRTQSTQLCRFLNLHLNWWATTNTVTLLYSFSIHVFVWLKVYTFTHKFLLSFPFQPKLKNTSRKNFYEPSSWDVRHDMTFLTHLHRRVTRFTLENLFSPFIGRKGRNIFSFQLSTVQYLNLLLEQDHMINIDYDNVLINKHKHHFLYQVLFQHKNMVDI